MVRLAMNEFRYRIRFGSRHRPDLLVRTETGGVEEVNQVPGLFAGIDETGPFSASADPYSFFCQQR